VKNAFRMALVPSLISIAVTALRLSGERMQWSPAWFSTQTGGPIPTGVSFLIGITWLPVVFGPYFASRVWRAGDRPASLTRAFLFALAGFLVGQFGGGALALAIRPGFHVFLLLVWSVMAASAAMQYVAWPGLFRALLAYGLVSRAAVALVMLCAMAGSWGTHYDYVGMPAEFQGPLLPRFLWLAFFPQLVFWVGYTILLGVLCGTAYLMAVKPRAPAAG
jgi:hypothetical protein